MEELADRYRRLAARLTSTIAAVDADRWSDQSPCADWTARQLVQHVIDIHGRFQAMFGRELADHPSVDEDPLAAFAAVRDQMQADVEDPAKVAEEYEGRFGRSTFGAAVDGFVCFDLVVHGWDLARATGQDIVVDPRDVERIQAMVEKMGDTMRENGVIAPPVDPPDGASDQDRLMASLGRAV
jgi:uncharacterized protein (TIGR03086 family)